MHGYKAMKQYRFWIGTYTSPGDHAHAIQGEGLMCGTLDAATGEMKIHPASAETPDPSYLTCSQDRLYAVAETMGRAGEVHAYAIENEDKLRKLSVSASDGINACFISLHGDGLLVANYMTDHVVFLRPDETGQWSAQSLDRYLGSGPHEIRQRKPHPHHCLYLGVSDQIAVCDLGSDRVWLHAATASTVESAIQGSIVVPPGTGPRHALSFGEHLYVLGELSGCLHQFTWWGEGWELAHSTAPVSENPWCAAIHLRPDSNLLFVSERNGSSLYSFRLNPSTGEPRPASVIESPARTPRDFGFSPDGEWLLVLGQDSSSIAAHRWSESEQTYEANPSSVVPCGTPVCVRFDLSYSFESIHLERNSE